MNKVTVIILHSYPSKFPCGEVKKKKKKDEPMYVLYIQQVFLRRQVQENFTLNSSNLNSLIIV